MSDYKKADNWLKGHFTDWTDEDAISLAMMIEEIRQTERLLAIDTVEHQLEMCDYWDMPEEVKEGVALARGAVTINLYDD